MRNDGVPDSTGWFTVVLFGIVWFVSSGVAWNCAGYFGVV